MVQLGLLLGCFEKRYYFFAKLSRDHIWLKMGLTVKPCIISQKMHNIFNFLKIQRNINECQNIIVFSFCLSFAKQILFFIYITINYVFCIFLIKIQYIFSCKNHWLVKSIALTKVSIDILFFSQRTWGSKYSGISLFSKIKDPL